MDLRTRRRALMSATSEPPQPKNGYVDAEYSKDSGDTVYSISNNVLSITKWKNTTANNLNFQFKQQVSFSSGDVIRVVIKKTAGSVGGAVYCNCTIGSTVVASNKLWNTGATALDESFTASSDFTGNYIYFRNRTGSKTYNGYKCTVTIYKNGTQYIPEL